MQTARARQIIRDTLKLYDAIAPEFAATRGSAYDFSALAGYVKPAQLILDAGCGNGRLVEIMRAQNVKMIASDGSRELIKIARKKYAVEVAAGWLGFTVATVSELPFDKNSFDTIFLMAVLHHIPSVAERLKILRHLSTLVKFGGQLIGAVWNLRADVWQKRFHADLSTPPAGMDAGDVLIPWKASGAVQTRYCHNFTLGELRGLFVAAGWKIKKLYAASKDLQPVADLTAAPNIFWVIHT